MEAKREKKKSITMVTAYLLGYNFIQFAGWTYINYLTVTHLMKGSANKELWKSVDLLLKIFQTGAVLEIIHGAIGFVKTNPVMAFTQIYSRIMIVWAISGPVEEAQDTVGVPLLMIAWTVTEIIRYSYYFLNLFSTVPFFLTWCRYTFFILLYPAGVTGELLCMYRALPRLRDTGMFSIALPNKINFSFNFYYYIIFMMIGYIPVFPQLYTYMLGQRRKVLSPPKKED